MTASAADINGKITTSDITADGGTIGGFTLGINKISSSNLVLSSSTNTNEFVVSASNFNIKAGGQITASNILADGGTVGGFTINNNEISSSGIKIQPYAGSGVATPSIELGGKSTALSNTQGIYIGQGVFLGTGYGIGIGDTATNGNNGGFLAAAGMSNPNETVFAFGEIGNALAGNEANSKYVRFVPTSGLIIQHPNFSVRDGNLQISSSTNQPANIKLNSDGETVGLELDSVEGIIGHGDITNREFETHNGQFRFTEDSISTDGGNGITYDDSSQEPLSTDFGTSDNNSIGNQGGTN